MSGHCSGCGVYHEEDDDRLCAQCHNAKLTTDHKWKPWAFDECPHCGSDAVEVFTTCKGEGLAWDGDKARCSECKCPGHVSCTGDDLDGESERAVIAWHDEPDCDCEWCKANPAGGGVA